MNMDLMGRRTAVWTNVMCALLLAGSAVAQDLDWMRTFGAEGDEVVTTVSVDNDGNTVLAGYFESEVDVDPGPGELLFTANGLNDAFVMKLDQDGALVWALQMGGGDADYATCASVDASGNVYVAGAFSGSADFDPGPGETLLTSMGGFDIFVAKFSPAGGLIDAWRTGGPGYDEPKDLAVGPSGHVYLLSYVSGSIDVDPGPAVLTLPAGGQLDMLVQRFNGDGELAWAEQTGSGGMDFGLALALDAEENLWITGSFEGSVDFDPGPGTFSLSSVGAWDIFVTKRSLSGELLWAGQMGGLENFDTGYAIAVDAEGNAIVAGSFMGGGDFDPGTAVHTLTAGSVGSDEIFVMKLAPSGVLQWAASMGGADADLAYGIGVSANGRILVSGFFSGTADLDPDPVGEYQLSTTSEEHFFESFLCELAPDGTFVGALQFAGANSISSQPMAMGPDDAVTIAGHFEGTVDMDPAAPEVLAMSNGFRDAFVVRLDELTAGLPADRNVDFPKLFPNPATDHMLVDFGPRAVGTFYVVIDEQGRTVASGRIMAPQMHVPLNGLVAGHYQLRAMEAHAAPVQFVVTR